MVMVRLGMLVIDVDPPMIGWRLGAIKVSSCLESEAEGTWMPQKNDELVGSGKSC